MVASGRKREIEKRKKIERRIDRDKEKESKREGREQKRGEIAREG